MIQKLSPEEQHHIKRISRQPYLWLREFQPELKQWEADLFDLIDKLKAVWEKSRELRVNLCFALQLDIVDNPSTSLTIHNYLELQKRQNACGSTLIYVIDLHGNVVDDLDLDDEIEPFSVRMLSSIRGIVIFWLGPEFEIFSKGIPWETDNKLEILKDIKSKQRYQILSMDDYKLILDTFYKQYLHGQAVVVYWLPGYANKVLQPNPEVIFQKSLYNFLNQRVDGEVSREHMFKDGSRCDIRVLVDYDLYFIEIKWIGHCARKVKEQAVFSAEPPTELNKDYAIGGVYQTKLYIENNNSMWDDHRIKLGIYLLYDAYPKPITPLDYGQEISDYPLLEVIEYQLVTLPPSKKGRQLAKAKGLI